MAEAFGVYSAAMPASACALLSTSGGKTHLDQARAGPAGVEFHLGYGDWIRLLHTNGLEVVDLIEVQDPARPRRPRVGPLPSRRDLESKKQSRVIRRA
jgi:hypothetical protein